MARNSDVERIIFVKWVCMDKDMVISYMAVLINKILFEEESILNSSCNSQHFLNYRTLEKSRRRKVRWDVALSIVHMYDGFETCLFSKLKKFR